MKKLLILLPLINGCSTYSLMGEMVKNREGLGAGLSTSNQYIGNTADLLDNYYVPGPERKHKSPTRRLINHKNSTTNHK